MPDMEPDAAVVIPTLNEEENIVEIVEKLAGKGLEVVVVDADSKDSTRQKASTAGAKVINKKHRNDLSSSVLKGIKQASSDRIVVMDGDGQHPVEKVDHFVERLSEHSLVVGYRNEVEKWPIHRKTLSDGAELFARSFFRSCREVRDPLSGFFALNRDHFEVERMRPRGYKVLIELLVHNSGSIGEIPYRFRERQGGNSSIGFREIVDFKFHLVHLKCRQLSGNVQSRR